MPEATQAEIAYLAEIASRNNLRAFVAITVDGTDPLCEVLSDKITDLMNVNVATALEAITRLEVALWMQNKRPALIYCNGSNPAKEVDLYIPLLRPGDIIGAPAVSNLERTVRDRGLIAYEPADLDGAEGAVKMWRR